MNRPEVTFVVSSSRFGGAETQALLLARKLKDRCRLRVVCNGGSLASQFRETGVPVYVIPLHDNADLWGLARLFFHLKNHRPNLLHLHMNRACLLGSLAGKLLSIPTIAHMQSFTRKLYARFADLVFVCAPGMVDYYSSFGIDPEKITVVFNAMDPEGFRDAENNPLDMKAFLGLPRDSVTALFAGRLHPMKGVREITGFAARALVENPSLHFVLVGDGEEMDWLEKEKNNLNLTNLHLMGYRKDVKSVIAGSDFMILPSYSEGLPVSLTEGLYLQKPFVAYDVNDVHVLAGTGGGILVPEKDSRSFYEAVLNLAGNREKRLDAGRAGRKIIDRYFSLEICLDTIDNVYRELSSTGQVG